METQAKFLKKSYLETRMRDFEEIRKGEIRFEVTESDRAFSRTLYITFYTLHTDGIWHKQGQMRISDHEARNCDLKNQLIIDPDAPLDKRQKEKFVACVKRCLCGAKRKHLKREMQRVEDELRGK